MHPNHRLRSSKCSVDGLGISDLLSCDKAFLCYCTLRASSDIFPDSVVSFPWVRFSLFSPLLPLREGPNGLAVLKQAKIAIL